MLLSVLSIAVAFPQDKDAKDQKKELKGQIREKASKTARKEAKKMEKEGWVITAGALPLDKQLEEAWMKQYEKEETSDFPKYIVANGNAVGTNYSAAKNQALNLAKVELAGLIATSVAGLAENSVANQDLSQQEAASVVKTVEASKSIIAQEIGRIIPLVEVYKTLKNKNVEVQVRIAYNIAMAAEAMKAKIVKKLEDETAVTHDKLEKMMGGFGDVKQNSTVTEDSVQ